MTVYGATETYQGACTGIGTFSSINGLTIENNVIGPLGEGVHINCYGDACEPTSNPAGPITSNITAKYNDFVGIRRIAWEEQPESASGIDIEYNSEHDAINPYYGNFAISMACCDPTANNTNATPIVSNNVFIQNTTPYVRYGYGIEAWGNAGTYNNNLIQGLAAAQGIAWCYGMSNNGTVENNTVQGPNYNPGAATYGGTGYIGNEASGALNCGPTGTWYPPNMSGNVTGATVNTVTSVARRFLPSSGAQSFPLRSRSPIRATPRGRNHWAIPRSTTPRMEARQR